MSEKQTRNKRKANQLCLDYDKLPPINRKIYNFIIERGLTQKEFADKIGITQQSVCRLFRFSEESNSYPKVTKMIREKMMKAYSLPVEWFIADGSIDTSSAPRGEDSKSQLARLQYIKEYLIGTGRITSLYNLSDLVNINRVSLLLIFDGKMEITLDFLNKLNETFSYIFNVSWVLTGEGEMLAKTDDKESIIAKLRVEKEELLKQLNDAAQEIIRLNRDIRELKAHLK